MTDTALSFERLAYDVNGTETVVLAAGDPSAPPLVFLHGAGTFHGFAFTAPWAEQHRVLVPYHPGYGESGDLAELREVHDLVLHYTALFDELGLTTGVDLVGFSLGGLLAARLAIEQKHRLRRLVLVAPTGLRVPGVDVDDLFGIPPEELIGRLAHHVETLLPHLPDDPHDVDFTVDRYREMRSTALMLWEHPFDRVVPRWLGRVDIPTLVVWGEEDRLLPVELAPAWAALLPDVAVKTFPDAGHLVLDESADAVEAVGRFCADDVRREALLLDVGYVIIDVSWRAVDALGRATGRSMPEPFHREPTPESWDAVAVAAGFDGFADFFRALCETVPDEMIDPASIALLCDARAAGRRTGVLSNDAYTFVGREFFASAGVRRPRCLRRLHRCRCPQARSRAVPARRGRAGRAARRGRVPRRYAGVRRWSHAGRDGRRAGRPAGQDPGLRPGQGVVGAGVTERVVITGANRGLGLELARRYAERGDVVCAGCRRPAEATELAAVTGHVLELDVASTASIDRFATPNRPRPRRRPHQQRWRRRPCTRRARRRARRAATR